MGVGQNGMIGTPQQAEVIILIRKYLCVLRELCKHMYRLDLCNPMPIDPRTVPAL
jgi:hypothetical protein